ncbi:hypothetical protein [Cysteiniphilum halobium]|uniref:hypothetical protein n=1 Tax=Cysteiniphilum halobium TaxID=2219059 RepID=UPI003F87E645
MNDHQKERLLKIAETNPELAKGVVDILKQESLSSHEPIAVKMVKSEEDKIEITAEQKKYAIRYITSIILVGLLIIIYVTSTFVIPHLTSVDVRQLFFFFPFVFILVLIGIFSSWFCAYKAGIPTIKKFMSKYFKSS